MICALMLSKAKLMFRTSALLPLARLPFASQRVFGMSHDGDNTVFLLAAVHVEHHFECSIYWADALLYKGLIHNRIGHEEIHEEKRPFLFAGTKSLPYLCQCNGNTNPFCRLNNTRRLLQKSFATYSSTTQTYSINTNFSKLWELSNKESWEASQEE